MIEREEEPAAKRKTPRKTERLTNLQASTVSDAGKALPSFPTNPEELAAQWGVGAEDTYSLMVKVTRPVGGTVQLLADVPLRQYDSGDLAGKFGPGLYFLRASPGKYAKRACKMIFSEEYCRDNGFGTVLPAPMTARDSMALETIQRAAEGPTNPRDLAAAIEQIMDRRDQERARMPMGSPIISTDPMVQMQAQMQNTIQMMEMFRGIEERAIKTVEMRMGIKQPEEVEMDSNSNLMEKLLMKGLDLAQTIFASQRPAQPAPAPPPPIQPQPQPVPALEEKITMPLLSPEEQNAIGGAVSMLKPYADTLMQLVAAGLTDEQIVAELDPWIPAPMAGPLANLAAVVAKHGPAVLGTIHPGLAVERWAVILPKLIQALQ